MSRRVLAKVVYVHRESGWAKVRPLFEAKGTEWQRVVDPAVAYPQQGMVFWRRPPDDVQIDEFWVLWIAEQTHEDKNDWCHVDEASESRQMEEFVRHAITDVDALRRALGSPNNRSNTGQVAKLLRGRTWPVFVAHPASLSQWIGPVRLGESIDDYLDVFEVPSERLQVVSLGEPAPRGSLILRPSTDPLTIKSVVTTLSAERLAKKVLGFIRSVPNQATTKDVEWSNRFVAAAAGRLEEMLSTSEELSIYEQAQIDAFNAFQKSVSNAPERSSLRDECLEFLKTQLGDELIAAEAAVLADTFPSTGAEAHHDELARDESAGLSERAESLSAEVKSLEGKVEASRDELAALAKEREQAEEASRQRYDQLEDEHQLQLARFEEVLRDREAQLDDLNAKVTEAMRRHAVLLEEEAELPAKNDRQPSTAGSISSVSKDSIAAEVLESPAKLQSRLRVFARRWSGGSADDHGRQRAYKAGLSVVSSLMAGCLPCLVGPHRYAAAVDLGASIAGNHVFRASVPTAVFSFEDLLRIPCIRGSTTEQEARPMTLAEVAQSASRLETLVVVVMEGLNRAPFETGIASFIASRSLALDRGGLHDVSMLEAGVPKRVSVPSNLLLMATLEEPGIAFRVPRSAAGRMTLHAPTSPHHAYDGPKFGAVSKACWDGLQRTSRQGELHFPEGARRLFESLDDVTVGRTLRALRALSDWEDGDERAVAEATWIDSVVAPFSSVALTEDIRNSLEQAVSEELELRRQDDALSRFIAQEDR